LQNHNEQFFQVGLLDQALISLGLALSPPSTSVSSDFMVLCKCSLKLYLLYTLQHSALQRSSDFSTVSSCPLCRVDLKPVNAEMTRLFCNKCLPDHDRREEIRQSSKQCSSRLVIHEWSNTYFSLPPITFPTLRSRTLCRIWTSYTWQDSARTTSH